MYVFSFFREMAPALHLAISDDLLHWRELNRQEPILESNVGVKYWRDPFIIQAEDGVFHLLCTDGWSSTNIVHASSKDLINWSSQELIPVMYDFPSAKNAWAPEAVYDRTKQEYLIFWSSNVPDAFPEHKDKPKTYENHRIYACTTKNFVTFSPTRIYFDPSFNCIDASINFRQGMYLMAFKDERGENPYFPTDLARKMVLTATAKSLDEKWQINYNPISKTTYSPITSNDKESWAEGPCVFWDNQTQKWWVFYEYFRKHQYGASFSVDGLNWTRIDEQLHFPEGAKHGTIFEVNNKIVIETLRKFDLPFD